MSKRHGMSRTRFYGIWKGMKNRCLNNNSPHFHKYGGNGIYMCNEWKDFKAFKFDMYESYLEHIKKHGEKNTTIDRIDGMKGYEPFNCRWATYAVQNNNKKSLKRKIAIGYAPNGNIHIFINQSKFAKDHKLDRSCVNNCLNKRSRMHKGWIFEYKEEY